ncbi:hypothetical protein IKF15_03235 [Candidatus Saccharibacteria bacterium]|nr:hypothetical protein [Candidatus Saccharibacteria bacterium]
MKNGGSKTRLIGADFEQSLKRQIGATSKTLKGVVTLEAQTILFDENRKF